MERRGSEGTGKDELKVVSFVQLRLVGEEQVGGGGREERWGYRGEMVVREGRWWQKRWWSGRGDGGRGMRRWSRRKDGDKVRRWSGRRDGRW